MSTVNEMLYFARMELGQPCPRVFRVSADEVRLPDYNKPRAKILPRTERAWLFDAKRSALGMQLCPPGAAAYAHTAQEAIEAVQALLNTQQRFGRVPRMKR